MVFRFVDNRKLRLERAENSFRIEGQNAAPRGLRQNYVAMNMIFSALILGVRPRSDAECRRLGSCQQMTPHTRAVSDKHSSSQNTRSQRFDARARALRNPPLGIATKSELVNVLNLARSIETIETRAKQLKSRELAEHGSQYAHRQNLLLLG